MKKKIGLIIAIVVLVTVASFFSVKQFTGNVVKENTEEGQWVKDNCQCIEQERIKCNEGYEWNSERNFCMNGNKVTYPLEACSKYNCTGEIWEMKN